MVLEEVGQVAISNVQETINLLGTIFKIILGIVGIYLIFWLINLFLNLRKNNLLKEILANLEEINNKLGKTRIK